MKKSQKLSIMYRLWIKEVWEIITEELTDNFLISYISQGQIVFTASNSLCVSFSFGEDTRVGLVFENNSEEIKTFYLPMQLALENLGIIKKFLKTGKIPNEKQMKSLIEKFEQENEYYFENELNYSIVVRSKK